LEEVAPDIVQDFLIRLGPALSDWLGAVSDSFFESVPPDDVAMVAGTGGTTGQPKGVQLTGHNLEAMTAITLMSYPFAPRPVLFT
jgi:fatty-acyl-CoA synthase